MFTIMFMCPNAIFVVVLLVLHATSSVHAILDQLEKYEIHSLSTYSHMNNARNGRKLMQSRGERKLSYEFEAFGRVLALELTRDDELFAADYKHYFVAPKDDGSHEYIVDENVDTKCHYKAIIKDDPQSIGRISLCGPGMRAIFRHSEIGQFHIEPLDSKGDEHAVYRALDMKKSDKRQCGVNNSSELSSLVIEDNTNTSYHSIPNTATPTDDAHDNQRRILGNGPNKLIRMLIVNDNLRYKQRGNNVHSHSAQIIASMDSVIATLGGPYAFDVQIVGMLTFAMEDPYNIPVESINSPDAMLMLNLFTSWMRNNGANFPADFSAAMLLSGYNFDGTTIGMAWVGRVCNPYSKASVIQTTSLSDGMIAGTAAHELGHNLGMQHDDKSDGDSLVPSPCTEVNVPHVMDPIVSPAGSASWSICSINWVKMQLEGYNAKYPKRYDVPNYPSCMEKCYIGDPNPPSGCTPVATWTASNPVCGDGLREGNEECDCLNKNCTIIDPCCDGTTCKLKVGSVCSMSDPCCSSTCQIVKNTNQVCRSSVGECDFSETCDGVNAKCPTDTFKSIGTTCVVASRPGTCYQGQCRSHWKMCSQIDTSLYDSDCSYANSDDGDMSCGAIHCHPTGKPTTSCIYYPSKLVENGTPCAVGKACLNQVCVSYSNFTNPSTVSKSPTTLSLTKKPIVKSPTSAPRVARPPSTKPSSISPQTVSPSAQAVAAKDQPFVIGLSVGISAFAIAGVASVLRMYRVRKNKKESENTTVTTLRNEQDVAANQNA